MPKTLQHQLTRLLDSVVDPATLERSLKVLHLPRVLAGTEEGVASRSLIALALNVALFGDLLERVPTGRAYVNDCLAQPEGTHACVVLARPVRRYSIHQ